MENRKVLKSGEFLVDTVEAKDVFITDSIKVSAEIFREMLDVYVYDTADLVHKSALDAVNSFANAEESVKLNAAIEKLTFVAGINVKEVRRCIADRLIENNAYKF